MAATCFVQPLDLVKNRMQVMKSDGGKRPSSLTVISNVVKKFENQFHEIFFLEKYKYMNKKII